MLNIIYSSKNNTSHIAGAALTFLNTVGINFSNLNLSNLSISNADLSNTYF